MLPLLKSLNNTKWVCLLKKTYVRRFAAEYSVIQKDGLNFVHLYFLNCTWYMNDLHNIWKRRSYILEQLLHRAIRRNTSVINQQLHLNKLN